MNRRQARLIRCGILAARDPELRQYIHLAPRLVREACRRETENIFYRDMLAKLTAARAEQPHSDHWDGYSLPQRAIIGVAPTTINAEHLRRFYA